MPTADDVEKAILRNQDVFGKQIADGTAPLLDVAAHYPQSPERWRIFVDGTRQLRQYNAVAQYNHATDVHQLQPAAGETVAMETAESPSYVVQYELVHTFACSINQALASGDAVRVGAFSDDGGRDGWYLEHDGDHDADEVDLVVDRAGTEKDRQTGTLHKPLTDFTRFDLHTAWYNITRQAWGQSFTESGEQRNSPVGTTSVDGGRGPESGNQPLRFEVQASGSTSGLVLNAGSVATVAQGSTSKLTRTKTTTVTASVDATGSWIPILALRLDPDKAPVNAQFKELAIAEYSGNDDVEVTVQSFDPSKVLDSGGNELTDGDFTVPEELSDANSAIRESTAVEQVPDSTGTTATAVSDPGGFQIGRASLYTGGGNDIVSNANTGGLDKRPIYSSDVLAVLARSASTGDVTFQYRVEENW